MFFDRIRRRAGVAGLVTAMAVAVPVIPAQAAVQGQPTPLTITPEFASRVAMKPVAPAAGEVQVAQASERRIRRNAQRAGRQAGRQAARREIRRDNRRDFRRDRREVRRDVRRDRRDWRRDRYDRRRYHNGRWYYGYGNDWYDDNGAWVAAGVIGLAAGAIAAGALANPGYGYGDTVVVTGVPAPYSSEWYRQCDIKYRSFRASDGTFLGYDGVRKVCRLP
jgi:hypothetical protein